MLNIRTLFVTAACLTSLACGSKFNSKGGTANTAAATPSSSCTSAHGQINYAYCYQGSMLNPDVALHGMGRWITIGNQRFFVPDSRYTQGGWVPYQNGRWMYDRERGWTWVSSDRFGWLTDHYGIWRHHRVHGWIWLPFHDMRYVPHAVTWFDEGDNANTIGWYPYYSAYPNGYVLGTLDGFNDGYWRGTVAVNEYVSGSAQFNLGFSLIYRRDAGERNLRRHIIRDNNMIWGTAQRAYRGGRFNRDLRHPGGDRERAYGFLEFFAKSKAPVGRAKPIRSHGGAKFLQPESETPDRDKEHSEQRKDRHDFRRTRN